MRNKITNVQAESKNRVVALMIFGLMAFLMFGLAVTARAATLYRQLDFGMSGSDVSSLQSYLASDPSIYPQGLVTGYFGSLTRSAVANFQTRNGLPAVGRVGPLTLALINQRMGGAVSNSSNAAPWLSTVNVTTTNNSAALNWSTNENASATIYYSTSPLSITEGDVGRGVAISGTSMMPYSDMRTSHSAIVPNLQPNTTYYYVVYAKDSNGNESMTWPSTFHTTQ